jgi:hypothetical protein
MNHMKHAHGKPVKQAGEYRYPVTRGLPSPLFAQLKGLIDGYAQDDVRGFQFLASGVEEAAHFVREPGEPILGDGTRPLDRTLGRRLSQGPTLRNE